MFRALFVGSLLVISLLTKTTPESAHEYSRLGTVESLVQRQTFQLDDSTFIDTLDKIYRDGHYYSHQPPLLALIEAPVYWGLHLPGLRFNNRGRLVLTYLFSLLTNGLALALTIVVFRQILDLGGVAAPARDRLRRGLAVRHMAVAVRPGGEQPRHLGFAADDRDLFPAEDRMARRHHQQSIWRRAGAWLVVRDRVAAARFHFYRWPSCISCAAPISTFACGWHSPRGWGCHSWRMQRRM